MQMQARVSSPVMPRVGRSPYNRRSFGYSRRYAGMPAIRMREFGPSGGSGPIQAVSNYA